MLLFISNRHMSYLGNSNLKNNLVLSSLAFLELVPWDWHYSVLPSPFYPHFHCSQVMSIKHLLHFVTWEWRVVFHYVTYVSTCLDFVWISVSDEQSYCTSGAQALILFLWLGLQWYVEGLRVVHPQTQSKLLNQDFWGNFKSGTIVQEGRTGGTDHLAKWKVSYTGAGVLVAGNACSSMHKLQFLSFWHW